MIIQCSNKKIEFVQNSLVYIIVSPLKNHFFLLVVHNSHLTLPLPEFHILQSGTLSSAESTNEYPIR